MKRFCMLAFVVAWMGAVFADDPQVDWSGETVSHGGDLNAGTNWVGGAVPVFDSSSKTGSGAYFNGYGAVTVPMTLGENLYLNSLFFTGAKSPNYGTVWDVNLGGRTLQLYGDFDKYGNHAVYVYGGQQKVRFRNGTLDFTGALANTTMMVMSQGANAEIVFSGSDTAIAGNPSLRAYGAGSLFLTNGVQATGYFLASRGGLTRIAGKGTVVDSSGTASNIGQESGKTIGTFEVLDEAEWKNADGVIMGANGYDGTMLISNATVSVSTANFGVGTGVYASNNVLRVTGGAKVSVNTTSAVNKGCITVGNGYRNLLEISGATTVLTGEGLTDGGASVVRVGEQGWYNTFHLTDSAKLSFGKGTIAVGANDNGVFRCDTVANRFLVDGGARLFAPQVLVGQVMNRPDSYLTFYHRDANGRYWVDNTDTYLHSNSNVFEISGAGAYAKIDGAVGVASQSTLNYNAEQTGNGVRVTDGAGLWAGSFAIGARGKDNFLSIGEGASVTSSLQIAVGGSDSSNSTITVAGGKLRIDTTYRQLFLKGSSSAAHPARLDVSKGGDVYAYVLECDNAHNVVAISNGTVTAHAEVYLPKNVSTDSGVTVSFSGTNSVLKMAASSNAFYIRSDTKLVFNIPAEGYSAVPIQGGNNVEISGTPTIELNADEYFETPRSRRTVLMQSGNYNSAKLNVSDEALASLNASVAKYRCRVELAESNHKLVLVHKPGIAFVVR